MLIVKTQGVPGLPEPARQQGETSNAESIALADARAFALGIVFYQRTNVVTVKFVAAVQEI